ncbi:tyrosine-type recombinase/integrase [Streptomyces tauricus]
MIERKRKKRKKTNTVNNYESNIHCHIIPFAGNRKSQTLTRRDTMNFVDYVMDKPSIKKGSTVAQIFGTWRVLMNYMIDADVPIPANIVSRIELPDVNKRVSTALRPEDVASLAEAMRQLEPRLEILIWIGACAGFRESEAFGLKKSAVAWDDDLLYVEEQRQHGISSALKTKASYASLPVDHFLIVQLRKHAAQFPGAAPVTEETARRRRARRYVAPPDEGLIVTNRLGRPLQYSCFRHHWKAAVQLAGLPEDTRFHDLKHFYTTRLGASGAFDPKTVQALSRHAKFSVTWDTYAHPPLAVQGVTVTTFASLFSGNAPTGSPHR